ncbi:hypothetical protein [Demequina sp. NBRC 110054]|uniref:hypothetical protein n=1 Tax=Demequina sp. NBRC 110054 TaxID=1570343 RepID=UPI000A066798|nr:hypothetical protein [Demequina sp. NBRC 110054]
MSTMATAERIAELRQRRRDIRREIARVRWWRRLVAARRELTVAALARPGGAEALVLDDIWEALAADAPSARELVSAVWPEAGAVAPGSIEELDALDVRLEAYEARVAENLETVTALMVKAMGEAHRRDVAERRYA